MWLGLCSMLRHRALPVFYFSREIGSHGCLLLLRLRLLLLFLVPRFSAVGDLRQELANALDICFGPRVDLAPPNVENLRGRHLAKLDISAQRCLGYAQSVGGLAGRIRNHSLSMIGIEILRCQ